MDPQLTPSRLLPVQAIEAVRPDILAGFLTLAHAAGMVGGDPCVCLGASEAATVNFIEFQCACHNAVRPCLVRKGSDWLRQIDFVNLFWPNGDQESAVNFQLVMECSLVARQTRDNVKVSYRLTDSFLRSISREGRLRQDIVDSVCARIIATQTEAMQHKGLQDEKSTAKHIPAVSCYPGCTDSLQVWRGRRNRPNRVLRRRTTRHRTEISWPDP